MKTHNDEFQHLSGTTPLRAAGTENNLLDNRAIDLSRTGIVRRAVSS